MEISLDEKNKSRFLILIASLIPILSILIISGVPPNVIGMLEMVISVSLAIAALSLAIKFRGEGKIGKAWVLFSLATLLWLFSDVLGSYGTVDQKLRIVLASLVMTGNLFCTLFFLFYIKTLRRAISKKMIIVAALSSIALVVGLAQIYSQAYKSQDTFSVVGSISNVALLTPALICVMLFFKGRLNHTLQLFLIGTVFLSLGNIALTEEDHHDNYAVESLEWMVYSGYVFFILGILDHIKIFRVRQGKSYVAVDAGGDDVERKLVNKAIEKALLEIGSSTYEKVGNTLHSKYGCSSDWYRCPEYLSEVLKDLFGKSHAQIIKSIKAQLGDSVHKKQVQEFLVKLSK